MTTSFNKWQGLSARGCMLGEGSSTLSNDEATAAIKVMQRMPFLKQLVPITANKHQSVHRQRHMTSKMPSENARMRFVWQLEDLSSISSPNFLKISLNLGGVRRKTDRDRERERERGGSEGGGDALKKSLKHNYCSSSVQVLTKCQFWICALFPWATHTHTHKHTHRLK